jgi:hypothetical protein
MKNVHKHHQQEADMDQSKEKFTKGAAKPASLFHFTDPFKMKDQVPAIFLHPEFFNIL